jgi:hypothetical protein
MARVPGRQLWEERLKEMWILVREICIPKTQSEEREPKEQGGNERTHRLRWGGRGRWLLGEDFCHKVEEFGDVAIGRRPISNDPKRRREGEGGASTQLGHE